MAGGATFSCDACGKQYPWKPELAGKKAKCKCGAVLSIPAQPQAARAAARTPVAVAAAAPVEDSQAYRCPACKADLNPGTAVCVNCGYDLRTGQYVSTQVDTGDDEGAAEAAPKKKKKKKAAVATAGGSGKPSATGWVGVSKSNREKAAEAEADKSRTVKQVTIALVLLVAVVGVIFGGKFVFSKMGHKTQAADLPGDDAEAQRMLENDDPQEAKAFIEAHKSRSLGVMWTQSKALAKIQQWYDMGAIKIWAFADGLISRHVVIELPKDPDKRKEFLNWATWFNDPTGQHVIKDVGQKYLIITPP